MIANASSSVLNSKLIGDRYNELRILKNGNLANSMDGAINFLYGYTIGNLDIQKY